MPDSLATVLVNTAIGAVPLALIAVGINLSYSLSGAFNVAHVQLAVVGAFITYWVTTATGLPIFASAVVAVVCVGALAVALRRTIIARLLWLDTTTVMIGTFAMALALQALLQFIVGSSPKRFDLPLEVGSDVLGVPVAPLQIRLVLIGAAALALYLLLLRIPFGRRVRAVAANQDLAAASGLRTGRINDAGWFLGGALACVGGVMIALTNDVSIQPGALLLTAFAASIIGGLSSLTGAIGGAFIVVFLEEAVVGFDFGGPLGTSIQLPVSLAPAAVFVVMVLVLIARPQGVFAGRVRRV